MLRLPTAFTQVPATLERCNEPATQQEIVIANSIRREYLRPGAALPYMEDVVRAFRVASNARLYIEVGTQDKGNIAWLARTKLARGATIVDIDILDYEDNDVRISQELERSGFGYHAIRGDCLSEGVLERVISVLGGRRADVIFCDSHYTYSHTLMEFSLYYPLIKDNGFLLFHDAQWVGNPLAAGEEGKKGKGLAIEQLDRFYPCWIVSGPSMPLFRPIPPVSREPIWGTVAIFPG